MANNWLTSENIYICMVASPVKINNLSRSVSVFSVLCNNFLVKIDVSL